MNINRFVILVVGVVVLLLAGIIYAWSILKAPFMTEFGWDATALGVNFTIMMCCFVFGGMLGGVLQSRFRPQIAMWIAAALGFSGFFLTSKLSGDSVLALYLTYGVLCGLGIGVVYNVIISVVTRLFPDRSTTASGVLMMGFGASTLVLGSVCGVLFEQIGWRSTFLLLAAGCAVIFIGGSFFVAAGSRAMDVAPAKRVDMPDEPVDVATKDMVRRSLFWRFYIYLILISGIGTCVISVAKDVSLSVGNPEAFAILIVGVLSVCNGAGRIVGGLFFDRFGRRRTALFAVCIAIAAVIICLLSVTLRIALLNTIGLVAVGFTYGFMPPTTAGFVRSAFGVKHFALNFSVANTMLIFASMTSTIGGGLYKASGSFVSMFVMLVVFAFCALGFFISLRKQL